MSPTCFTGYETEEDKVTIQFLYTKAGSVSEWKQGDGLALAIFDQSCFYPEGGGPIGDIGTLKTQTGQAQILDCQNKSDISLHQLQVTNGKILVGQQAQICVDKTHRQLISTSHSATHLLHQALREVLGMTVKQKGSLVLPGKLRFDFSHNKPCSKEELQKVQDSVQKKILGGKANKTGIYPFDQARKLGALYLQGENYQDKVRVVELGDSKEFCGGIHVSNTKDIGHFKIVSEQGVQSGVRRILAYTNSVCESWLGDLAEQSLELKKHLGSKPVEQGESEDFFVHQLEELQLQKSSFKNLIKNLKFTEKPSEFAPSKKTSETYQTDLDKQEFLARQNLRFRDCIQLAYPKDKESENPLVSFFKKQQEDLQAYRSQLEELKQLNLSYETLLAKARDFTSQGQPAKLLMASLPIEDSKLLADVADQLKSHLPKCVVLLQGRGKEQAPFVVLVSKDLQKNLSAGDIFKKQVAPFLEGKGGGQARFAQGKVKDVQKFPQLEARLLEYLHSE